MLSNAGQAGEDVRLAFDTIKCRYRRARNPQITPGGSTPGEMQPEDGPAGPAASLGFPGTHRRSRAARRDDRRDNRRDPAAGGLPALPPPHISLRVGSFTDSRRLAHGLRKLTAGPSRPGKGTSGSAPEPRAAHGGRGQSPGSVPRRRSPDHAARGFRDPGLRVRWAPIWSSLHGK